MIPSSIILGLWLPRNWRPDFHSTAAT